MTTKPVTRANFFVAIANNAKSLNDQFFMPKNIKMCFIKTQKREKFVSMIMNQ